MRDDFRCTTSAGRAYATHAHRRRALRWQDLVALLDLLQQRKIRPLIAERFPLAQARQAHELLQRGSVTGKIVLVADAASA